MAIAAKDTNSLLIKIFHIGLVNNIFERSAGLLDDVDVAEPRSKSRHDILNQNDYTPEGMSVDAAFASGSDFAAIQHHSVAWHRLN